MEENKALVRRVIEVTSSGIFRVSERKVAESRDHFDALGMLEQLGATLGPTETS